MEEKEEEKKEEEVVEEQGREEEENEMLFLFKIFATFENPRKYLESGSKFFSPTKLGDEF